MKFKQSTLLGVALLLTVGTALTGCGKGEDKSSSVSEQDTTNTTNTSNTSDDSSMKPLDLSVAVWDIQTGFEAPNAQNDTVYNDLTKKFNVTIKPVNITWNDWQEKAKVWAASKQLPDMFADEIDLGLYQTWAKQGVIKPLPDDLSPYPNLQKLFTSPNVEPALRPLKVDGKYYAVPRFSGGDIGDGRLSRPIRYRKDWAAEAGFTKDPASFDEFLAMTKAVMQKHPGITGLTVNNKDYLFTPFLGSFPEFVWTGNWTVENGKWIPAFTSERAYTGIQQLRTLYSEGVLDKDFAIQKDADGTNKFLSGQSFALFGMDSVSADQLANFKKANPDVNPANALGYLNIWPAADGKRYSPAGAPYWSKTFFSSSISDEKFERSLQMLDYMLSDEYRVQLADGIENVDYKVENGQYVSLLKPDEKLEDKYPITSKLGYLAAWDTTFFKGQKVISSDPDLAALQKDNIDTFNRFKQENSLMPVNFEFDTIVTPGKNKLQAMEPDIKSDIIKVILGNGDPIEQWKEIVKGYDSKGIQEAIKEVNDEVAKRGIK